MAKYDSPYSGSGSLTREQFLFHETKIVAKLMVDDQLSDDEIVDRVVRDNLFQFPTERMIKNIAKVCVKRLRTLDDMTLIGVIAHSPMEVAKQACLYAMMKQYRLVWDYMITVIGAKYREQDFSYGRIDLNVFFMRLQEQDDEVASWSEATINKIKQVLNKILIENDYIDSPRATALNPVMICSEVENAIRANGEDVALPAFNCFY
ncbi:Putative inner membrane protein [Butyrivibrio hungatei DSM 14810]|uniref:Putative inner membrane protein n=1 Tax=Butyrivibrio hungatei DSM 14810 TaxID=1121132 RepID=A0A1M7RQ60_9FIRM|nr:DUF1819 family protein [Butyrivibrio hungatei]SHN48435.1 Putative inner membrane protein [Butyrivibrio hungatei DSM 14810]